MSNLSQLAHQLTRADYVQLFGTIVSGVIVLFAALIGVHLGNRNARKVQQQEAKDQRERDRETEAARFNAFLQAIQEEISASWNIYVLQVGHMLENEAAAAKGLPYWPCYGDYFEVFKANANNIGMVKNEALRNALITTYILARSHIDTYQAYNRSLSDLDQIKSPENVPHHTSRAILGSKLLSDYSPRLIKSHNTFKRAVENCLKLLDAELHSSPTELLLITTTVPEETESSQSQNLRADSPA